MNKIITLITVFAVILNLHLISQNLTCDASEPFCTGLTITYPAGTSDSAELGADYGCLSHQPAPAWFHMVVEDPGNITIYMYSNPSLDIDFICWGPFGDPHAPCVSGLTYEKIVDCSFSPNPLEFCEIPDAQTGEYYILMITNYSLMEADITFSQSSGSGSLNCDIVEDYMPDLLVQNQFVTPDHSKPGDSVSVTCFLANAGPDIASNSYLRYYLSYDNLLNTENDLELGYDTTGSLLAGQVIYKTDTLIIPPEYPSGPCFVLFRADADDLLAETNENNNLGYYPIYIDPLTLIDEQTAEKNGMNLKIYPNPARDKLSIEFLQELRDVKPVTIEIQNITGSFRKKFNVTDHVPELMILEIRDLMKGMYILKIKCSSNYVINRIFLID